MNTRVLSVGLAASLALVVGASAARAAELVTNGGFETGDFTGWSTQSAGGGSFFQVNTGGGGANGSDAYANFGSTGGDDQIFQVLPTISGEQYVVSFYMRNTSQGSPSDHLFATWEGNSIFNQQPVAINFDWTQVTVNVTATQNGSELRLGGKDFQDVVRLDEVSVTGEMAPEPASLALLTLGAATMLRRRRNK